MISYNYSDSLLIVFNCSLSYLLSVIALQTNYSTSFLWPSFMITYLSGHQVAVCPSLSLSFLRNLVRSF